jgi:hypothetical protein
MKWTATPGAQNIGDFMPPLCHRSLGCREHYAADYLGTRTAQIGYYTTDMTSKGGA